MPDWPAAIRSGCSCRSHDGRTTTTSPVGTCSDARWWSSTTSRPRAVRTATSTPTSTPGCDVRSRISSSSTEGSPVSYVALSKTVSHALRHEPWVYELELDDAGWVPVDDLLRSLRDLWRWRDVQHDDLVSMVA